VDARRLATLIQYFSNDTHRLWMLPFVNYKSDDVGTYISKGLGHQRYMPTSGHAIRNALGKSCPREHAKLCALGMSGSPRPRHLLRPRTRRRWQQAAARWWRLDQGPAVTS